MKKVIFTFRGILPEKLGGIKTAWSNKDVTTVHKQGNHANNTDTGFYKIVRAFAGFDSARQINAAFDGNSVLVEIVDLATNEKQLCLCDTKDISRMAVAEQNANGIFRDYSEAHAGNILKAAVLSLFYAKGDMELSRIMTDLIPLCEYAPDNPVWDDALTLEKFSKLLCQLSSNLYYQVIDMNAGSMEVTLDKLRQSNYEKFIQKTGLQVICGKPSFFVPKKEKAAVISPGQYRFSKRKYNKEELELIPQLDNTYIAPEWVKTICADLKDSTEFNQPLRNVLLSGSSGGGKTKGVQALANYLGMPCVIQTCSPDTDMFDLIGQMLPNTDKVSLESVCNDCNIPSFDDVEYDYEECFRKLFGKEPTKMDSPADCYAEIMKRILNEVKNTSDFTYVESNLIKAVRNGWVVEIQEPTVIKREAVLVGLNALLENDGETAKYTLPNGEVVKRHPDCIVVLTTNSDYKGCKSIQQSVLSRMDMVREVPVPELDELVARCKAQTGFKEMALLKKMAQATIEMNQYCKDHDITDGVCGPRELNNWAKHSIILSRRYSEAVVTEATVIHAAFTTILTKCSQVPEEMEEVITSSFQKFFNQTEVENARELYEAGAI